MILIDELSAASVRLKTAVKERSVLRALKMLSILGFCCASAGLFVFGNYLMIGGHRPLQEVSTDGYIYPISAKGAPVYVSKLDLMGVAVLAGLLIASMIGANWADKKIN